MVNRLNMVECGNFLLKIGLKSAMLKVVKLLLSMNWQTFAIFRDTDEKK